VVTGCASGLGAALASTLLEQGHRVHGIDVNAAEDPRICFHACDIRCADATAAVFARIAQQDSAIDNLFNFAGIRGSRATVEQLPSQDFSAVLEVNLFGTFHATRLAIPLLSRRGGNIINVGSILGAASSPARRSIIASNSPLKASQGMRA